MGRRRGSSTLRVLIADDHRLLLEALVALLEPLPDIEVVAVTHESVRVLSLVAEHRPDVVVLHYGMPGPDGLTLLDRLRRQHPDVAIAFLTGSQEPGLQEQALERGATSF